MRTLLNSVRVVSIDLSMRRFASSRNSSMVGISPPFPAVACRDHGSDLFAARDAEDVAPRELEDVDRSAFSMQSESAVVSMTRRPRSIASRWVSAGRNVASGRRGVAVVDALRAALRHQDRLGADFERPQGGGGVGGEERVAGAGREDDDTPFSRCRIARRRMYGSATSETSSAESTRVSAPGRSSASWSASALRTVASIPA